MIKQGLSHTYIKHHVVDLPGWFSIISSEKQTLNNSFILSEIDVSIEYSQAKKSLKNLEFLYHTRVNQKVFLDFFKVINFSIANPLTQPMLRLKMKPLYQIFKELPLIVFNEQTCRDLALLSPFFPSAHDIDKIMSKHIKKITHNIELLRQLIQ